jgi:hypothetical protein
LPVCMPGSHRTLERRVDLRHLEAEGKGWTRSVVGAIWDSGALRRRRGSAPAAGDVGAQ